MIPLLLAVIFVTLGCILIFENRPTAEEEFAEALRKQSDKEDKK